MVISKVVILVLAWALPSLSMSTSGAALLRGVTALAQRANHQPRHDRAATHTAAAAADRVTSLPGWDGPTGFDLHAG